MHPRKEGLLVQEAEIKVLLLASALAKEEEMEEEDIAFSKASHLQPLLARPCPDRLLRQVPSQILPLPSPLLPRNNNNSSSSSSSSDSSFLFLKCSLAKPVSLV